MRGFPDYDKAAYDRKLLRLWATLPAFFVIGLLVGLVIDHAVLAAGLGGITWAACAVRYVTYQFLTDDGAGLRRYTRRGQGD
ncbi:hypothetical protein [Pseudofrankia asymbiotica]|uniref:Uncharacterized protein n=1 Tax=Pseudofrankia asymbiotica TaxID=1834516 RepID=A0A1V2IG41_9ACTN|nr:hypothetical protein [Pseudofrankia asymbiotica]ONH31960.1 hypothetical protein BL253_07510 [Pseudofrankia asymbiotica]